MHPKHVNWREYRAETNIPEWLAIECTIVKA
jgi:hypothetical protein